MKTKTLKIAVSGIGWCGAEHIKAFQRIENCKVILLHGRSSHRVRENLRKYCINYEGISITERYEDIIEDSDVDIVSIAGINSTHTPYAIAAAQRGKHLMIEKPVARDLSELESISSAIQEAGVHSIVSFELYWNPLFQVARWLKETGRLGNTLFVRSNYHSRVGSSYSGWNWCRTKEEGRNILLNSGCHSIDAVRQFADTPVRRISAFHTTGIPQGYEYPTTIHVNMEFGDGILGQVSASADVASPYHFGLEIYGSKLTLNNQFIRWSDNAAPDVSALESECPVPGVRFFLEPYSETQKQIRIECTMPNSVNVEHHPFQHEAQALVDAVRTGNPSPLSLPVAAITHRICFAADESAANNGTPVTL